MEDTSGFYKLANGELLYANQSVESKQYSVYRSERDSYTYPINGWHWFNSRAEAIIALNYVDK